jgi:hypothetical protein
VSVTVKYIKENLYERTERFLYFSVLFFLKKVSFEIKNRGRKQLAFMKKRKVIGSVFIPKHKGLPDGLNGKSLKCKI